MRGRLMLSFPSFISLECDDRARLSILGNSPSISRFVSTLTAPARPSLTTLRADCRKKNKTSTHRAGKNRADTNSTLSLKKSLCHFLRFQGLIVEYPPLPPPPPRVTFMCQLCDRELKSLQTGSCQRRSELTMQRRRQWNVLLAGTPFSPQWLRCRGSLTTEDPSQK